MIGNLGRCNFEFLHLLLFVYYVILSNRKTKKRKIEKIFPGTLKGFT